MSESPETLGERLQADPIGTLLEGGTVVASLVVFLAVLYAITRPPGQEPTGVLLGVVVGGSAIVAVWTVVVPLLERVV